MSINKRREIMGRIISRRERLGKIKGDDVGEISL